MEFLTIIYSTPPNWFVYATGFASLIALFFVILYFLKPHLKIEDSSDYQSNKIRITCTNKNLFPFTIKDIKCDIVASKDDSFKKTDTLKLYKDWITGICYNDNYVFKVKSNPTSFSEKKFLKVRILAINILGVKKYYQKVFEIPKF